MTDTILDRLEGVRETGPGRWLAKCPSHDDRSPSLSIRKLDSGQTLLHDFGGCHVDDVLRALGITMADLFPNGPIGQRIESKHRRIPAADVLAAIDHEAHVIAVIAADFLEHRGLDDATWQRLVVSVRRIGDARALCCPARKPA